MTEPLNIEGKDDRVYLPDQVLIEQKRKRSSANLLHFRRISTLNCILKWTLSSYLKLNFGLNSKTKEHDGVPAKRIRVIDMNQTSFAKTWYNQEVQLR